jgi:hypothetical protein
MGWIRRNNMIAGLVMCITAQPMVKASCNGALLRVGTGKSMRNRQLSF